MFLTNSTVHIIGMTEMRPLDDWAKHHNLVPQLMDASTPLGNIGESLTQANLVEFMGRHCYRSWSKGRATAEYIENIIDEAHTSVMEHTTVNLALSGISRSLSHELVRHRVGVAISQESQRYVDAKDVNFVVPPLLLLHEDSQARKDFEASCLHDLEAYKTFVERMNEDMVAGGSTLDKKRILEAARSMLPNAAETRMGWSINMTALRHFFKKRGAMGADLEIRRLAVNIFNAIQHDQSALWMFFYDMGIQPGDFNIPTVQELEIQS